MPKVSRDSAAQVDDLGPMGVDRHEELDGYTVNINDSPGNPIWAPCSKASPTTVVSALTGATSSRGN
jgi:hypothetical protein